MSESELPRSALLPGDLANQPSRYSLVGWLDYGIRVLRPLLYLILVMEIFIVYQWETFALAHLKAASIPVRNDSEIAAQAEKVFLEREELDAFGSFVAMIILMGIGVLLFHSIIVLVLYVGLRTATQIWILSRVEDYKTPISTVLGIVGMIETVLFYVYTMAHVTRLYKEYIRLRERQMYSSRPMYGVARSFTSLERAQEAVRRASLNIKPLKRPQQTKV